jgi:alpha/beta superfamily hydrolase
VAHDTDARALTLTAADGVDLEAELRVPTADHGGSSVAGRGADARPRGAVVLAHPHPQQGGSMASLVTAELFRLLPERGLAALRFNFRGVGASGGEHGHGRAEALDLTAALDAMVVACPNGPLVVCGWSFGADVSLSVTDARIAGWAAVAPPLAVLPLDELTGAAGSDPRPKLLVVPAHDQFRPPDRARAATATWRSTTVEVVAGADHFLVGRTGTVASLVEAFATSLA